MNKTGKKQPKGQDAMMGGIRLNGGMGQPFDEYIEKPRHSLYNVIKKLKEMGGPTFNRICYIAKINETQLKGDQIEKEITNWTNTVCMNQDVAGEDEITEFGGFAVVLGPWIVHMFEADSPLMMSFMTKLQQKNNEDGSYYQNIWVLHYTEDVPSRAYPNWTCKSVQTNSATREIKSLDPFSKILTIYDAMVTIGNDA